MTTWIPYIILIIGFVLLTKGADLFVDGAAAVAEKLRIPVFIIGMTIVAMGTSAPECAVSITASLKGNNELAVSNVVGSNIFNLMVVCGVCALVSPLEVKINILKKEFPFSILVAAILLAAGSVGMSIGRVDGLLLLLIFAAFLCSIVLSERKRRLAFSDYTAHEAASEFENEQIQQMSVLRCLISIGVGLAAVILGGNWVVDGASAVAKSFGMSQNLIGLTVVAFGTSLPELVTSFAASRKHQADMALGNVIGSNIFNILLILGLSAIVSPISFNTENIIDTVVLILMSTQVFFFCRRHHSISRAKGLIMLIEYAVYVVYICIR